MGTRKKTTRKKASRKKTTRKKTVRKGARRKPARKKTTRRKAVWKKAPARRRPPTRRPVDAAPPAAVEPTPAPAAKIAEGHPDRVGFVMHYWDHVNAAAVRIERGQLRVGDTIHVRGHTTDYYQRIDRLELEHAPVDSAGAGHEVGVHVSQRVREGDSVYKVT